MPTTTISEMILLFVAVGSVLCVISLITGVSTVITFTERGMEPYAVRARAVVLLVLLWAVAVFWFDNHSIPRFW